MHGEALLERAAVVKPWREAASKLPSKVGVVANPPHSLRRDQEANVEQWDIEDHPVNLADHILGLIETIQKSYLAI